MLHIWLTKLLQPVWERILAAPAFVVIVENAAGKYLKENAKTGPMLRASLDPTALSGGVPSSIIMGAGDYEGQLYFIGTDGLATLLAGLGGAQHLADNIKLGFGTGAGGVADIGVTWNGTKLVISQLTANSAIDIGVDDAGIDLKLYGDTAGAYMLWDQSANSLILAGGAPLVAGNASFTKITLAGPEVNTKGADTAAAGSATGDAGVLPARTSNVYTATGADDTKGVRIHADDDVAGTTLIVLNAVNNKILKIYPPTGGTVNGGAANAAFSTASGGHAHLYCSAPGTWFAW